MDPRTTGNANHSFIMKSHWAKNQIENHKSKDRPPYYSQSLLLGSLIRRSVFGIPISIVIVCRTIGVFVVVASITKIK